MQRRSPAECAEHFGSPELGHASFGALGRDKTCYVSRNNCILVLHYHTAGG